MQVRILGSSAGGGFPQWNCSCANCSRLRRAEFPGVARTQVQLAWSSSPGEWTLLNASPDLRFQIEAERDLWPQAAPDSSEGGRHSPIRHVILTGAEVDQTLGLLLLREFHSFRVYSTAAVRRILTEGNNLFGVLARFPGQVVWEDISMTEPFCVGDTRLEVLPLPGTYPGFVSRDMLGTLRPEGAVIGLLISSSKGGRTLAFLPQVGCVSDALLERLEGCDAVLFDGTFWSDEEPSRIPGLGRTARQMGHLPISGGGSLERLASLRRPRKIYIHINNTNPILDEESPQHHAVREAGWEVARDGMRIDL